MAHTAAKMSTGTATVAIGRDCHSRESKYTRVHVETRCGPFETTATVARIVYPSTCITDEANQAISTTAAERKKNRKSFTGEMIASERGALTAAAVIRNTVYINAAMKPPRLVLLRPRNADNLGAIARAMKNFGLFEWIVVSPNPRLLEVPGLNRLAVKSGDLLESVRRVDTFAEAIADCTWVVGTTMRQIEGQRRLTPRELAVEAAARSDGTWALVFGDERNGLLNEDVQQCHALSFIPSSDEQPSLNLSQAVIVYAYELAMAQRGSATAPGPALADDATLRQVRQSLELGLASAGFLRGDTDDRHAVDDLMASLVRARLTKKEAALWTAAWRVVAKKNAQNG